MSNTFASHKHRFNRSLTSPSELQILLATNDYMSIQEQTMKIPTYKRDDTSRILERGIQEAFTAEIGQSPSYVTAQYLKIYNSRWRFEVSLNGCVVTRDAWEEDIRSYGTYDKAGRDLGLLLAAQWQAEMKPKV